MTQPGTCSILNVVGGDTKISFDKRNPAEAIRAARIIRDMLRRGYALLVEVERNGEKAYERAIDFREDTAEYIIADYDPEARPVISHDRRTSTRMQEKNDGETSQEADVEESKSEEPAIPRRGRPRGRKAIPADSTSAVAVARSSGG